MSTIVIQYEILHEQCEKLHLLSFTHIAQNLQDASGSAITQPSVALQKSRLVLEEIIYDFYELEMHAKPKLKNIRTLLNNRNFISKIHPRRIYLLMELVFKMTSTSNNDIVEAKAAKIVLDYVSDIVEWFIHRYDRSLKASISTRKIPKFEDILPPLDPKMLDQYSAQDYEHAASWFEFSANKGNASAQYNLGFLYNHGRGVQKDYVTAKMWYEKAAAQHDANALYSLGVLYHLGQGVEQNYQEAAHYYKAAADFGNADAQYLYVL